jgi:hypothetical protein
MDLAQKLSRVGCQAGKNGGLTILAIANRTNVDAKVSFGYPHPAAKKAAAQGVFHLLGNRTS